MAEADPLSSVWWDAAGAVNFLRDGTVPARVNWRPLPAAVREIRILNAAIQAGNIDIIEIAIDGTPRQLTIEDKALLELRFRENRFLGEGIGVVMEVIDVHTGRRRGAQKLLLRAADVRALPATFAEPEYKKAPESTIRAAIKKVYDDAAKDNRKPPNINELPSLVRSRLNGDGFDASVSQIKQIGDKPEFKLRRGKVGVYRTRRR